MEPLPMIKYHTYRYQGPELFIGRFKVQLKEGDMFCLINDDQVKVNQVTATDCVISEFLHNSEYLADFNLQEYKQAVQADLNHKHRTEMKIAHYADPNFFWESVTISR